MADVTVRVFAIPEDDLDRDVRCSMPKCDKMARVKVRRDRTVQMWRPGPPFGNTGTITKHTETFIFRRCRKHTPKERP